MHCKDFLFNSNFFFCFHRPMLDTIDVESVPILSITVDSLVLDFLVRERVVGRQVEAEVVLGGVGEALCSDSLFILDLYINLVSSVTSACGNSQFSGIL